MRLVAALAFIAVWCIGSYAVDHWLPTMSTGFLLLYGYALGIACGFAHDLISTP